jgi:hypothetical protein
MSFLKRILKRQSVPICLFCYHKVGTALLNKVFSEICEINNWKIQKVLGKQSELPKNADIILFCHSLVDLNNFKSPFIGVHLIRDPRDIIVSGYLYHCRTNEKWCINSDFDTTPPIKFPKVPYSQQHRSEKWKKEYIESLGGQSYQQNLLNLSQRDGIFFEMNNYGAWTIESMKNWNYNMNNILELKFEELMTDYDNIFQIIFQYIGFSKSQIKTGMEIAKKHDLRRKSDQEIQNDKHISSRNFSKWKKYFEEEHKKKFNQKFGEILINLGYETNNNW